MVLALDSFVFVFFKGQVIHLYSPQMGGVGQGESVQVEHG